MSDSVGFAIAIEDRYKGIRAPHKIKAAVSGKTSIFDYFIDTK